VTPVLGPRALNRAFLARQLLLDRSPMSAADAIEWLVGLQAQAPHPPYFGLWTRLAGFQIADLVALYERRAVVRIALMRSTLHLVTAPDALYLRPLTQSVVGAGLARRAPDVDVERLAAVSRAVVEEAPRQFAELGRLLGPHFPETPPDALAAAVRALLPLVQVTPRGIWGTNGPVAHTTIEHWLGRPLHANPSPEVFVRRYLGAFGPATVADMQKWSGLTRLRTAFSRLPDLLTFHDAHGRVLYDLPDAPRPDPDMPAPVRFLAEWDNALMGHADRTRILPDEHFPRVFTGNGLILGTVLVDGVVAATWRIARRGRRTATLRVTPLVPLRRAERAEVTEEGTRLLAFAAADAESSAVVVDDPA